MNKKVLAVGQATSFFRDLNSCLRSSEGCELLEARNRSEALEKIEGMIDAVVVVPEGGSEQDNQELLSILEAHCSTLNIPIFVSYDPDRPLTGTAEFIPRSTGPAAVASRITASIAIRDENARLAKANALLGKENEKLRDIHFLTLEYATMIENDLMDRIKALAKPETAIGAGPGSADESNDKSVVLRAENNRLRLEIEKLNVILSTVISHDSVLEDQLDEELKETNELARRDPLTQLYNRMKFNEELVRIYADAQSGNRCLSLIMFDIDHFKQVNDKYGHDTGDEVLRMIARVVTEALPARAVFARWGGEEFMVLAADTDLEAARATAEVLRLAIREARAEAVGQVTCSFGVIQVERNEAPQSFLKRLDKSLYEAKESGRDCVMTWISNKGENSDD